MSEGFDVFTRAENHLKIPYGQILTCEDDRHWIFIGWSRNTVGLEAQFVQVPDPNLVQRAGFQPFGYHASGLNTLLRKFPELKAFQI